MVVPVVAVPVIHVLTGILLDVAKSLIVKKFFPRAKVVDDKSLILKTQDLASSFLIANPNVLKQSFNQVIKALRSATSSYEVDTVVTAHAVSDLVQHFNISEICIVAKGLSLNPYVKKGTHFSSLILLVIVIRYRHEIVHFILSIIMDQRKTNPTSLATDALLVALLSKAISDPVKVQEMMKSLSKRDKLFLQNEEFSKFFELALKTGMGPGKVE